MKLEIPTLAASYTFELSAGQSAVLIGANGAGKTRLGVYLEQKLADANAEVHRIGAHRSLNMNTKLEVVSFERAESLLRTGADGGNIRHRLGSRWNGKPATALLSDFDHLLRALYSDENKVSAAHLRNHRQDRNAVPPETKLDKVKRVWDAVLPHRELILLGADVKVRAAGETGAEYDAGEMSDGERVIFYLIGQSMMARDGCIIIVDEPELHIHKAILSKIWDAIESERTDCAFVYLTHDLEFAAARTGAIKLVLRSFDLASLRWELAELPEDMELPEDVVAKIVGSRQPILFVEGDRASLDLSVYRRVYTGHTVIAVGSCDEVIHAVATFNRHKPLHRLGCAGLIDADGRDPSLAAELNALGVTVLSVAEVENLFALPTVFTELAKLQHFDPTQIASLVAQLQAAVVKLATDGIDAWVVAATKRALDRALKRIGLAAKTKASLATEFTTALARIDVTTISVAKRAALESAIATADLANILKLYDNKALLSEVVKLLRLKDRKALAELIGRTLRGDAGKTLRAAIERVLPRLASAVAVPETSPALTTLAEMPAVDPIISATANITLPGVTAIITAELPTAAGEAE